MTVVVLATLEMAKALAAKKVAAMAAKPLWVWISLLCGLLCEFAARYLIDNYHWTISQPLNSALYSSVCVSLFYFYSITYSKRILMLSLLSGLYGLALLITLNGTYYTMLSGIVWHNALNFDLLYRALELFVAVRTLKDARIINRVCNSSFYTSIRSHVFGGKNSFTGAL